MKLVTLKALVAFISLSLMADAAAVRRSPLVIKESVPLPSTWVRRSDADDNESVALRFALKQSDVPALENRVRQTSDPNSELYGQHLSAEDVSKFLQPHKRSTEEVELWLRDAGIHIDEDLAARSPSKDTFTVHVPVWQARQLLNVDLGVYEHKRSGALAVRAQQYSVPEHVSEHLDYVGPLTLFTDPRAHKSDIAGVKIALEEDTSYEVLAHSSLASSDDQPSVCDTNKVTSLCLRTFYKTVDYVPKAANKFKLGLSGFLEQYASFADFTGYLEQQRPDAAKANYNFTVQSIAGGLNLQSNPGDEANLDVQTMGGFVFPIPFEFYTTKGSPPYNPDVATVNNTNEPYELQMNYLLGLNNNDLPKVLSTSYGDDEQSVPRAYAERVCNYILALGARGVSTIYSSGDNGVGANGTCFSNGATSPNGTYQFLPAFPASCPWATTVGATQNFAPEIAVDGDLPGFYSGGGFSKYFPTAWYQADAVYKYVGSLGNQYKGLYNPRGRGYPDVAAQGSRYVIRIGGKNYLIYGTSASAPTFASIIGLLNDARISKGLPSLGFLNPLIYTKWLNTPALNDITIGSSNGCNTTGFPAKQGWDAVTGAGTPNFVEMMKTV
ncbi:related to Tripeptidyl-peptidase I precursor [Melanopsichium pennsylvanicum]|uniref:tripeptidyl-peptidase II n=2 Tax=Melanopsichium pennsylvanicum TaxID=63383 RepID=A0AAJ4XTD4_9BASI|nr:related to Tripeptidyl-peptidase I precursor [Melanopsichium pennsylvanicum 4]SNX87746.1 related to Tripeptidyl-peptidase I precursor [Melanopsichium pennsylvanicum]